MDDRVEKIKWRHCIDLKNGQITKGTKNTFVDLDQWQFPQNLFEGKTVLDVGACDGCFSFYAEQHGAKRVLALDPYRWTYDDRWSGMAGFNLAKEILGSKVETSILPLENISEKELGRFDIVLFMGVFYHLPDPLDITEKIASVVDDTLVLETHIDTMAQRLPIPVMRFYPNGEVNGDKTTYWGPNTTLLSQYLKRIGFSDVQTRLIYNGGRSISYAKKSPGYKPNWGEW